MRLLPLLLLCIAASVDATDHDELDATLLAPYRGALATGARTFRIVLDHPQLKAPQTVNWRLELAAGHGAPLKTWRGAQVLDGRPVTIDVAWDGALPDGPAPAGKYRVTLVAEEIAQGWDIAVGPVATVTFPPVLDVAPSPWRIVLGNLHSQTGHSDGGGDLATCHGAQDPQSSPLGPGAAFAYADAHGLDFLVASEHNHLFDGSTGTNAAADPAAARGPVQSGPPGLPWHLRAGVGRDRQRRPFKCVQRTVLAGMGKERRRGFIGRRRNAEGRLRWPVHADAQAGLDRPVQPSG